MKLIIQIPCFNEAETLPVVFRELPTYLEGIDVIETLVIDDGSTDGTSEIARELGVTHIVRHTCNRGLASSYALGIKHSLRLGADVIVNTDGDNQYPGRLIDRLVRPILCKHADVVIGDRSPWKDKRTTTVKRCLQWCGAKVLSLLAGMPLADPVSGFRAMSRDAAISSDLISTYSYTIESLLKFAQRRMAIEFVPIETNAPTRPSRLFRSIPQFVLKSAVTALRIFFLYHALRVLSVVACGLALMGLLPIVRFLLLWSLGDGDGHVQSLVLGTGLLLLSSLIMLAGLISDLIACNRIMIEEALERLRRLETTQ